ncbi:aminoglycoside phosphotransferase family protein [Nocardiopsis sediminis]|uniref:Aminoglycoside phosphotransferase family protein n=1 Tax=Nocardiopsis sediminis TaxID=1778267 RepID=A0ABV8FQU3_9ACTN
MGIPSGTGAEPPPVPEAVAANVRLRDGGERWLRELPGALAELRDAWGLRFERAPYSGGSCSWAAPVRTADGSPAVLKVSYPHREASGEATALRFWAGDGAVRLLRSSRNGFSLLLEGCTPGTPMSAVCAPADELLTAGAHTLVGLWGREATGDLGLEPLDAVLTEWAALLRERLDRLRPECADPGFVHVAADLLESLPATAARTVVLHGDFNPGNILAAERAPWLAIDPKPMVGDPGYDLWPLLVQVDDPFAHPDPEAVLCRRLALVSGILGEPVDRLAAWCVARTVESAFERFNLCQSGGREEMERAEVLARIAGV